MSDCDFDNVLFKKMRMAKFTQDEIAEKLRVKTNSVYNWEKGKFTPNRANINKIEALFGVRKHFFEKVDIETAIEKMASETEEVKRNLNWEREFFSLLYALSEFENTLPEVVQLTEDNKGVIISDIHILKNTLLSALIQNNVICNPHD